MKNIMLLICTLLLASGCTGKTRGEAKSNKTDTARIIRFDKDLYDYIRNPSKESESGLISKYPALLPAVGLTTINMEMENRPNSFFVEIRDYFDHPMLLNLYKDALDKYGDVTLYEDKASGIRQIINEILPNRQLPNLAFHVSGFKENAIVLEGMISISIDKYLGTGYELYRSYFNDNQRQQMQSQMILRDYLKAWIMSEKIVKEETPESLLTTMIEEGKILYALALLLPDYKTNDIIGYTDQQISWCRDNEKNIWQTLAKQDNIFSTDRAIIAQHTSEGFSPAYLSNTGIDRIGCWIGWQIVNNYAKNNKFSLSEILSADSRTILKNSRYNP